MSKLFAVLFVIFTGGSFWLSAFAHLLVIAIISWVVSAAFEFFNGNDTVRRFFTIIMLLSGAGAAISLVIWLLKLIF